MHCKMFDRMWAKLNYTVEPKLADESVRRRSWTLAFKNNENVFQRCCLSIIF